MIVPENCKNIEDVRTCIDSIDNEIIKSIATRSLYVKNAAKFKSNVEEIKAPERVRKMLLAREKLAIEYGLKPEFISNLFRYLVDYFISEEIRSFDNPHQSPLRIEQASIEDAKAILGLQKRAFIQSAEKAGKNYNIAPIVQTIEELRKDFSLYFFIKATIDNQIVGSCRANTGNSTCAIGRVIVEPIFQKRGYGTQLMNAIETHFNDAKVFEIFTGHDNNEETVSFYSKRGYVKEDTFMGPEKILFIRMKKINNR
jgi:chorismate mutase/ribosomal protein S18 acetylase RimI-like enzyme